MLSVSALLKGLVLKVTRPGLSGARRLQEGCVECAWRLSLLCLPPLSVCPGDPRAPQERPRNDPSTAFPWGKRTPLHRGDVRSNRQCDERVLASNCSPGGFRVEVRNPSSPKVGSSHGKRAVTILGALLSQTTATPGGWTNGVPRSPPSEKQCLCDPPHSCSRDSRGSTWPSPQTQNQLLQHGKPVPPAKERGDDEGQMENDRNLLAVLLSFPRKIFHREAIRWIEDTWPWHPAVVFASHRDQDRHMHSAGIWQGSLLWAPRNITN